MPSQMIYFRLHYLPKIWIVGVFFTVILICGFLYNKYSFYKIEKLKASNKAKLLLKKEL